MDSVRRVAPGGPTGFSRDLAAACRVEDRVCLYFFCGPSRSIIEPIQSLLRMLDRKEPQVTAHKHKTGVRPHKLVEQYQGRRSPVCPDGDLRRPHHDIQRHRQEAQSPAPYEARRCLGADPETVRRRLVKYGARIHDRHGQGTSTRFDGCVSLVDGDAKTNNRTTRRSRPQRNSSARRVRPSLPGDCVSGRCGRLPATDSPPFTKSRPPGARGRKWLADFGLRHQSQYLTRHRP